MIQTVAQVSLAQSYRLNSGAVFVMVGVICSLSTEP